MSQTKSSHRREMRGAFWRVYRDEWLVVHVSDADGDAGYLECEEVKLTIPVETRVVPWSATYPGLWPWMVEVRAPVMKGEWVGRGAAASHAAKVGGEVVREGSEEDREMVRKGTVHRNRS